MAAGRNKGSPLDLLDPAFQQQPFATYTELRDRGAIQVVDPVATPLTFVISHFEVARRVLRDPHTFSSRVLPAPLILFLDPPDHDRIRRTVSRVFTPPRIAGLEPRIEQIASELVQGYAAAGGGEFIEAVAGRLPVYVIGEMLGIPTDDWEQIREWSEAALRGLSAVLGDPDPSTPGGAVGLHAYLGEIADRRAAEPDESLASRLVEFEQAGEINREELVGFLALMFVAGHETTSALLAHTLERLAGDPDLLTTLQADPDLIGPFVEEMLRTYSPLQRVFRVATCDTQVEGVDIPAGSTVVVLIGAGNRDGARFPAGDEIDLTAPDTGHMAFGQGIHYCLGAPLARLEARIAIRRILESVSEIRLDPSHPVVRFAGGSTSELNTTKLWLQVESKGSDTQPFTSASRQA